MGNVARDVIWLKDPSILLRVVFLHVGQGSSTIILAADGGTYRVLLVDINMDGGRGGLDVPRLVKDLVGNAGLDVFVNSHPHNDHLCGVRLLADAVPIEEVRHSGHVPGRENEAAYKDLLKVIAKVKEGGGSEEELRGSQEPRSIGEAQCYVLAPAQHVKDSIEDESPEERRRRIHEQCVVLKFGLGDSWIMLPGDADRDAWEKWITKYHQERLQAAVFAGSHHGSRTFFLYDEEKDEPYLDALRGIDPQYVVLSAPKRKESKHGHPHEVAVKLYAEHVGEANVLHTGALRHCFVCDIFRDGQFHLYSDKGELVEAYPIDSGEVDGGGGKALRGSFGRGFSGGPQTDGRPVGMAMSWITLHPQWYIDERHRLARHYPNFRVHEPASPGRRLGALRRTGGPTPGRHGQVPGAPPIPAGDSVREADRPPSEGHARARSRRELRGEAGAPPLRPPAPDAQRRPLPVPT